MAEDETAVQTAWLARMQGVTLDEARVREPAVTARRLSELASAADAALPFGVEPSSFFLAQAALRRGGGGQGGGRGGA